MSATNVASTMLTMLVNNPLVEQLDLSSMRVMSCGGSPQSPAVLTRAIAVGGRLVGCWLVGCLVGWWMGGWVSRWVGRWVSGLDTSGAGW